jgi:hypothetical protein
VHLESPAVPSVSLSSVVLNLGEQVAPRHDLHHQQGLLGLNAGPQEGDDVRVAASLQDEYLLDEALLLGWSGRGDNLDGHIRGSMQQPQEY